ncbi:MAG: DUF5916 domain-containing protein [Crocinitomicaceae bacterium]
MSLVLRLFFSFSLLFIFTSNTCSQHILIAKKTDEKITIDGEFEESVWKVANWTTEQFIQVKPFPGQAAHKNTLIAMSYDKNAIYFAVKCLDHQDSISRVLSVRDDYPSTADIFGIFLDTYNDHQNGFYFGVTSRGVQLDAKIFSNDFNDKLNLAWDSKVTIQKDGWYIEIEIPYSAIRFPKKEIQDWNINFGRQISRYREDSSWEIVNPDLENFLLESGKVRGVEGIQPPLRLALMPYLSGYLDRIPQSGTDPIWNRSLNGGMDIKYGLNEAFTLDMTLIPDFGQVVFDQQVLNLSPFEVQFNENRQFFTEGTELFNKSGLFYSRRIGIQASSEIASYYLAEDEYLNSSVQPAQLLNASKLSGRMKNGLGIGVFNAVTAEQIGTATNDITGTEREVIVSPLTNYNVFVADQNLKNNSSVTFTNTNVWRSGEVYDANVSGLNFNLNSKNNNFFLRGNAALSSLLSSENPSLGYTCNINIGKQRGTWIYGAGYIEESDKYDPNDLGFNYNNNRRIIEVSGAYRNFSPKSKLLSKVIVNGSLSQSYLYNPGAYVGTYNNMNLVLVSRKFDAGGLRINSSLTESYDYFEPRTWGETFIRPTWSNVEGWISTNYQKPFALDGGVGYVFVGRKNWIEYGYNLNPRVRFNNNLSMIYEWSQDFSFNSEGYAVAFSTPVQSPNGTIFGNRNRVNTIQSIAADCILTNRMAITFRLRHYRSAVSYNKFAILNSTGHLDYLDTYNGLDNEGNSAYDINYNAFTIDMQYKWVFLPGSELNIVWKNSIFTNDQLTNLNYWTNLTSTFDNGPTNSFSMKIIYWLDAQK